MIDIDEVQSTANRLQLIIDNCEDTEERFMAFMLKSTLERVVTGHIAATKDPSFKSSAEEWLASLEKTDGR